MRGMIILTNNFEDTEALLTVDLLRRASILIDLVSLATSKKLITQSGVKIETDYLYGEINLDDYDFLVIPGGKAVSEYHFNSSKTFEIIEHFNNKHLLIAAICAAPSLLGIMGLLKNKKFTCFPGFEKYCKEAIYTNSDVECSENFITAKAAGSTFLFAAKIIEYEKNIELAKTVLNQVYYK